MSMRHVATACLVVALAATALAAEASLDNGHVLCVCRCCYNGVCKPLPNGSFHMAGCGSCTADLCRAHIRSRSVRRKIAGLFDWIQEYSTEETEPAPTNAAAESLVAAGEARAMSILANDEAAQRRAMEAESTTLTPEEQKQRDAIIAADRRDAAREGLDVCEIIAVTEAVGCPVATQRSNGCGSVTDLSAECYDPAATGVRVVTIVFLVVSFVGTVLALVKNYHPAWQSFNLATFDF